MKILKQTKYLMFVLKNDSGKTLTINIHPNAGGDIGQTILGQIKWYGPWRRYAFFPSNDCLFDASCLSDVLELINELMAERKKS